VSRLHLRPCRHCRFPADKQSFGKLLRHPVLRKLDHLDAADRSPVHLNRPLRIDLDIAGRHLDLSFGAHDRMPEIGDQASLAVERKDAVACVANAVRSLDLKKPIALYGDIQRITRNADPPRLKGRSNSMHLGKYPFAGTGRSGRNGGGEAS
jgi:hypothetical protein